jgi:hypothetical protein
MAAQPQILAEENILNQVVRLDQSALVIAIPLGLPPFALLWALDQRANRFHCQGAPPRIPARRNGLSIPRFQEQLGKLRNSFPKHRCGWQRFSQSTLRFTGADGIPFATTTR